MGVPKRIGHELITFSVRFLFPFHQCRSPTLPRVFHPRLSSLLCRSIGHPKEIAMETLSVKQIAEDCAKIVGSARFPTSQRCRAPSTCLFLPTEDVESFLVHTRPFVFVALSRSPPRHRSAHFMGTGSPPGPGKNVSQMPSMDSDFHGSDVLPATKNLQSICEKTDRTFSVPKLSIT